MRSGKYERWQETDAEKGIGRVVSVPEAPSPLKENEYRIHVGYDMPRDRAVLEAEFSPDGVSEWLFGECVWQNHPNFSIIDQTPGERIFLLHTFGYEIDSLRAINEMRTRGYRPATHLEMYAFAKARPDLQHGVSIIALGSFAQPGLVPCSAMLSTVFIGKRVFSTHFSYCDWDSRWRFLFVRK